MRSIFFIVSIILITSSCKEKEKYNGLEYDGYYVKLISKEKTEWVLELSCVYSITPADIEDPRVGMKERSDILNGKKLLSNYTIENLDCGHIFDLPKSLYTYKDFIDSVKNNDSIDINTLSYPKNGIYINQLINRGYKVWFDDNEGMFYASREKK